MRDRLPRRQVAHGRVDQVRARVRVVDDDEQPEAGKPRRVRLPLEPVQRVGQALRRDPILLDAVEAAAVDLPRLAADAPSRVRRVARRFEVVVERDEVERRADPGDRRDHVQPAEEQVAPVPPVVAEGYDVRHRSIAIATSSSTAVWSSSSRESAQPLAQDRDDLAPRPAVHEHDEPEAERGLVLGVQTWRARRARPGRRRFPARAASARRSACRRRRITFNDVLANCCVECCAYYLHGKIGRPRSCSPR